MMHTAAYISDTVADTLQVTMQSQARLKEFGKRLAVIDGVPHFAVIVCYLTHVAMCVHYPIAQINNTFIQCRNRQAIR